MPIYVERFLLPILAGVILVVVMQNFFSLSWDRRLAVFLAVTSLAYLLATAIHRTKPEAGPLASPSKSSNQGPAPAIPPQNIDTKPVAPAANTLGALLPLATAGSPAPLPFTMTEISAQMKPGQPAVVAFRLVVRQQLPIRLVYEVFPAIAGQVG